MPTALQASDQQEPLEQLTDPAAIARVWRVWRRHGWPPSEEDVARWRERKRKLDGAEPEPERLAEAA